MRVRPRRMQRPDRPDHARIRTDSRASTAVRRTTWPRAAGGRDSRGEAPWLPGRRKDRRGRAGGRVSRTADSLTATIAPAALKVEPHPDLGPSRGAVHHREAVRQVGDQGQTDAEAWAL